MDSTDLLIYPLVPFLLVIVAFFIFLDWVDTFCFSSESSSSSLRSLPSSFYFAFDEEIIMKLCSDSWYPLLLNYKVSPISLPTSTFYSATISLLFALLLSSGTISSLLSLLWTLFCWIWASLSLNNSILILNSTSYFLNYLSADIFKTSFHLFEKYSLGTC